MSTLHLDYCRPSGPGDWHEQEPSWLEALAAEKRAEKRDELGARRDFGKALAAVRVLSIVEPLSERFKSHAEKWERETAFLSATPMRVLHDSYQSIMAMGPDVVPLLLADLQTTRRHWFWALRHLTNVDPVPEKYRGNVDKMIEAWVDWGKREGKL
jgi:hypothetical protein